MLTMYGFLVTYISLNGAQTNRVLMKIFLLKDQAKHQYLEKALRGPVLGLTAYLIRSEKNPLQEILNNE